MEPRTADVVIKDTTGTEIATLYNTDQQTSYRLVDVSQYFWSQDTTLGESIVDVLFKIPKSKLLNDSDSFYAGDAYDDAWYHMAMFVYFSPLENRKEEAKDHRGLAVLAMTSVKTSEEGDVVKTLNFGRNKFYDLFTHYNGVYVDRSIIP